MQWIFWGLDPRNATLTRREEPDLPVPSRYVTQGPLS